MNPLGKVQANWWVYSPDLISMSTACETLSSSSPPISLLPLNHWIASLVLTRCEALLPVHTFACSLVISYLICAIYDTDQPSFLLSPVVQDARHLPWPQRPHQPCPPNQAIPICQPHPLPTFPIWPFIWNQTWSLCRALSYI